MNDYGCTNDFGGMAISAIACWYLQGYVMTDARQKLIDKFYKAYGDCCAGCDHWRWQNTLIGECMKSLIISGEENAKMLGIESCSANLGAGQALTKRDYVCGNFIDTHEWS